MSRRFSTACRGLPALPFRHLHDAWLVITLRAWICPSAKNCLTQFHNGWPKAVGFSSRLTVCLRGKKPTVPRRHWRCGASRREIQPREIRLALPAVPAHARSSACNHCVSARTGNGNDAKELEEVHRRKAWRGMATRFFRSSLARSSRTGRENQLHPNESGSQRIVRASGGLDMGLLLERSAAVLVGRAVLCTPSRLQFTRRRARSDAPYPATRLISSSDAGFPTLTCHRGFRRDTRRGRFGA